MADEKPIIVVKKKGHHGGHHGGAWKVAYADFVTAMMAFFMVMWLVNTADTSTKKAIAVYFRKPGIFETGSGAPLLTGQTGIINEALSVKEFTKKNEGAQGNAATPIPALQKTIQAVPNPNIIYGFDNEAIENQDKTQEILEKMAAQIRRQLGMIPEIKALIGEVEVTIEPDGIKIEVVDTDKTSMFASGSARVLPAAEPAFGKIAELVKKVDFPVDIVGHTDSKPFSNQYNTYSNWELSADRANAARRILEKNGVNPTRIARVLGMADRDLRNKEDPFAAANRRITLKMRIPNDSSGLGQVEKLANDLGTQLGIATPSPVPSAVGQNSEAGPQTSSSAVAASGSQQAPGLGVTISPIETPDPKVPWKDYGRKEVGASQSSSAAPPNVLKDAPIMGPSSIFDGL